MHGEECQEEKKVDNFPNNRAVPHQAISVSTPGIKSQSCGTPVCQSSCSARLLKGTDAQDICTETGKVNKLQYSQNKFKFWWQMNYGTNFRRFFWGFLSEGVGAPGNRQKGSCRGVRGCRPEFKLGQGGIFSHETSSSLYFRHYTQSQPLPEDCLEKNRMKS